MAKSADKTEETTATVDSNDVPEPTKHVHATQPTATSDSDYVTATEDLFFGGVRAHAAGDRVPTANVERNGWSGSVK